MSESYTEFTPDILRSGRKPKRVGELGILSMGGGGYTSQPGESDARGPSPRCAFEMEDASGMIALEDATGLLSPETC